MSKPPLSDPFWQDIGATTWKHLSPRRPERKRSIARGRWGWAQRSRPQRQEIFSLRLSPPHAGEERDCGLRTMGVGLTRLDVDGARHQQRKIIALGPIPPIPPATARNGTPTKGRWGWC